MKRASNEQSRENSITIIIVQIIFWVKIFNFEWPLFCNMGKESYVTHGRLLLRFLKIKKKNSETCEDPTPFLIFINFRWITIIFWVPLSSVETLLKYSNLWLAYKASLHNRVTILNRGSMPRKRTGKKVMQIFPTAVCNVTAWRHFELRAHWLMALVGEGGGGRAEGEVCILRSPGIAASPISLLSVGGA